MALDAQVFAVLDFNMDPPKGRRLDQQTFANIAQAKQYARTNGDALIAQVLPNEAGLEVWIRDWSTHLLVAVRRFPVNGTAVDTTPAELHALRRFPS